MSIPDDLGKFDSLVKIIARLRGPDGCPWDLEQTHQSLRENLLSECYEVLEALDSGEAEKLREELGDLLFAVVNWARWLEVDPETALRKASARFASRFRDVEKITRERGQKMATLALDELEALWQQVKSDNE